MKILVLVQGSANTGAKACLKWFLNWLVTTGHEITLFQLEYEGAMSGVDERVIQCGFDKHILRLTLGNLFKYVFQTCQFSSLLTGIGIRVARKFGGLAPNWFLRSLCSHRKRYDVAISFNDDLCNCYVRSFHARRSYGWIHEDYSRKFVSSKGLSHAVGYLRKLTAAFCVSKSALRVLQEFGHGQLRLFCFHNLLPVQDVVSGSGGHPMRLLSVGRLEKVKRFDECLQIGAALKAQGRDFKWMIVGDGSQMKSLKNLAKQLEVVDEFSFVGGKSNWYDVCGPSTIFVQPSESEGWGLVVEEAALRGAFVVCSDLPVFHEVAEFLESSRFAFSRSTGEFVTHIVDQLNMLYDQITYCPSFEKINGVYAEDKAAFLREIEGE